MRLVVASNNAKKRREIAAILGTLGIELVAAAQTVAVDVVEDAPDFAGNAAKKAMAFAAANRLPALADDSGLCVDALDGAPGVYSARYAGTGSSDADNNRKLLAELAGTSKRRAHFVCALHLAFPDEREPLTATGRVDGWILDAAVGICGFGYDPIFFCPELGKTFAEASAEEKASLSHRGRALRSLAAQLKAGV